MKTFLTRPPLGDGITPQFWLLVAITVTGTLAMHIFVPALPAAAAELRTTPTAIQLTITLYLVGLALGQLVYGPLSDRFGRRPVVLASLALYTVGLVLAIPATSVTALIGARVLQSLGACGSLVLGRAMVRDSAQGDDVIRRLSTLTIAMTLTPALAPFAGGIISTSLGWRAIFIVLTVLVGALLVIVALALPETNRNPTALPNVASITMNYARLMQTPTYPGYVVAGACCTTSYYAFLSSAPFLFIDLLHRSVQDVGLYCLIVIAGMVGGATLARQLASRLPIRRAARTGAALCIVGSASLLGVDLAGAISVPAVIAPMVLFSIGIGLASPNAVAGLMKAAPHAVGSASSLYGFAQMAFGAGFTLIVALWHDGTALPVAATLLGAALLAQLALVRA